MTRIRKAWETKVSGFDGMDIVYAETRSRARYLKLLEIRDCFDDVTFRDIGVRRAVYADRELPERHWLADQLTPRQQGVLLHAYGADSRRPGYRDHFCTAPGNVELLRLSWEFGLFNGPHGERGYGETGAWSGAFFYLTELGRQVAASMLPTYPIH